MQLPQKQRSFSQFWAASFKSILNLKCFEEKDDADRFCNCDITDSENVVS